MTEQRGNLKKDKHSYEADHESFQINKDEMQIKELKKKTQRT